MDTTKLNCYACASPLLVGQRFVCKTCWDAMPQSLHLEWAQCSSEKGKLRVIRKVKKLVQMRQNVDSNRVEE